MKKINAFTLAEVLITLGIIGVVAAITIPGLISNYKAQRSRSQFLKVYSTLQQVFKQMESDDISLDPATYKGNNGPFYKTFIKYLQAPLDCGSSVTGGYLHKRPCYSPTGDKNYLTYDGRGQVRSGWFSDGQIALQDGSLLLFHNNYTLPYIWISVDINGYASPPNRWGYDLFTFQFLDGELKAMGAIGTRYTKMDTFCNEKSSDIKNGIACAQKVIEDTEYFKTVLKKI